MKNKAVFFLLLLACLFLISTDSSRADDNILGYIDDVPVSVRNMSLTKYMQWYQRKKDLYDFEFQYFEEYTFGVLLNRLAREQDLDPDEYLRIKIFSQIPPVTNGEIDEFLKKNDHLVKKSPYDQETLRNRVKQALLEEKKNRKILALKKDLFSQARLVFNSSLSMPRLQIDLAKDDHRLGPENPKLQVVAFFDLMCPYSREAYHNLLAIQKGLPVDLGLVFKHFPLGMHNNALQLAIEAECAGQQGAFFPYVDGVFEMSDGKTCPDCARILVERLNLDPGSFRECLEKNDGAPKVGRDIELGKKLGLTSVPTMFFNGFPVLGLVARERLTDLVEQELARK